MTQHAHNEQNQHEKPTRKTNSSGTTNQEYEASCQEPRFVGARTRATPVYFTHFTVSFEELRHLNSCCYSIVGINNEWNRKLVARELPLPVEPASGILYFYRAQEIALPELLAIQSSNRNKCVHLKIIDVFAGLNLTHSAAELSWEES